MGGESDKSFWVTLPGILTGIAAIITAIGGILLALHTAGYFDSDGPVPSPTPKHTPTPTLEPTPTPTPETNPKPTPTTPTLTPAASTKTEINITYPLDSKDVQMKETVKGTATNIPEGQQLWIVIRFENKYFPQNYVDIKSDGSWELPVQIGEGNMGGSTYDIEAVLADKNAQNEFNNYLNTFEKTGVWPEMTKLPDGSKVKVKVSVGRL